MDPRQRQQRLEPRQPQPSRPEPPNTLGQAWQRMQTPRRHTSPPEPRRNLPVLPDWPPLPEERSQSDWQPLDPWAPAASQPATKATMREQDALHQTASGDRQWPQQPPRGASLPGDGGGGILSRIRQISHLRRLHGTPTRTWIGITVGAAVMLVVLIIGCSSLTSLVLRTATSGSVTGSASRSAAAASAGATTSSTAPNGTPHPLPTVTPVATNTTNQPTPTAAPPQQPLTLAFTCASGSLHGTGQVCVHTQPQAVLSLAVRYCDGSTAKGLHGSATADASGNYTWTWPVRSSCTGTATATVTASWKGQSLSQADTFTITP